MTTVEDTFPVLGPDGRVTYITYAGLPTDIYMWDYWGNDRARSHFRFELVPMGRIIRIYIVIQPAYQGRSESSAATHRYQDENGRHYICVSYDNQPQTVAEAMTWYAYWAEQTLKYIATGRAFS